MNHGLRVLVADDDPELLQSVAHLLEHAGADVACASTGAELTEALGERGPFDLVVTDVSMPWMTGLQAMHSSRYAGLATPVLVMTALRDEKIPEQVRALGERAALLHKPFSADRLLAAVEALTVPVTTPGDDAADDRGDEETAAPAG